MVVYGPKTGLKVRYKAIWRVEVRVGFFRYFSFLLFTVVQFF